MAYVTIVRSALEELKAINVYHRRQGMEAIDNHLTHQPMTATRNRKKLVDPRPTFAYEPPLWELRIGSHRVYYDVDPDTQTVFIRAVRDKPPHQTTDAIR